MCARTGSEQVAHTWYQSWRHLRVLFRHIGRSRRFEGRQPDAELCRKLWLDTVCIHIGLAGGSGLYEHLPQGRYHTQPVGARCGGAWHGAGTRAGLDRIAAFARHDGRAVWRHYQHSGTRCGSTNAQAVQHAGLGCGPELCCDVCLWHGGRDCGPAAGEGLALTPRKGERRQQRR